MVRSFLAGEARGVGPVIWDEEMLVVQRPLNVKGTAFWQPKRAQRFSQLWDWQRQFLVQSLKPYNLFKIIT